MSKIGIVTKFEVVRQLKKPSFWAAALLLPMLLIGLIGFSSWSGYSAESELEAVMSETSEHKVGYTDKADMIIPEVLPENYSKIESKEAGIDKIKSGELDEYYYIGEDFSETMKIEGSVRVSNNNLFSSDGNLVNALVSSSATRTRPEDIKVFMKQYEVETTTYDSNGEESNVIGKAIIPFLILGIFYVLICVFGNRMLMAVVEEKENRISEMILTAVSAKSLIIGKILALIILGLLQMLIFVVPVLIVALLGNNNAMIMDILSKIEVDPISIIVNVVILLLSYFLFTGACTYVGSLMPTAKDASQWIGVVLVGVILPIMFISSFVVPEPSAMTYALTYFPLSTPIALMLRNAFGTLPWYELMFGIVELAIFSVITIYLAAKSFQKNAINFSLPNIFKKIKK